MKKSSPDGRQLLALALTSSLLVCASVAGCGERDGGGEPTWQREGLFGDGVQEVILEVDYQPGAAPYTEYDGARQGSPWELTEANLARLFEGNGAALTIPRTLEEMQEIGAQEGPFDVDALLELSEQHRDVASTEAARSFHVLFLDGYYEDEDGVQRGVLGVSIGDTGVIAMFKPVIDSTGGRLVGAATERFVEQTTLVHEFGHAAGLVNNGLEMATDHHDEEHGAHCDNDGCVMFWQNEGTGGLIDFVRRYVIEGDLVVFGGDCLADVDAASP